MNKYTTEELKKIGERIDRLGYVLCENEDFYKKETNGDYVLANEQAHQIIKNNLDLIVFGGTVELIKPYLKIIPFEKMILLVNNSFINTVDKFMKQLKKNGKTKYKKTNNWEDVDNSVKYLLSQGVFIYDGRICEISNNDIHIISDFELARKLDNEFGKTFVDTRGEINQRTMIINNALQELPVAPDYLKEYLNRELFTKFIYETKVNEELNNHYRKHNKMVWTSKDIQ